MHIWKMFFQLKSDHIYIFKTSHKLKMFKNTVLKILAQAISVTQEQLTKMAWNMLHYLHHLHHVPVCLYLSCTGELKTGPSIPNVSPQGWEEVIITTFVLLAILCPMYSRGLSDHLCYKGALLAPVQFIVHWEPKIVVYLSGLYFTSLTMRTLWESVSKVLLKTRQTVVTALLSSTKISFHDEINN